MLHAGKLRHRVVIESREESQDEDTGALTVGWVEFATVWASVEPMSAREFIQSAAVQSDVNTRIVIRYLAGVDATMRVIHRGDIYNIRGVLSDKVSGLEYLTLPCATGVNEGE
jgi:SPP1 family predicted phage head-tail adaptor